MDKLINTKTMNTYGLGKNEWLKLEKHLREYVARTKQNVQFGDTRGPQLEQDRAFQKLQNYAKSVGLETIKEKHLEVAGYEGLVGNVLGTVSSGGYKGLHEQIYRQQAYAAQHKGQVDYHGYRSGYAKQLMERRSTSQAPPSRAQVTESVSNILATPEPSRDIRGINRIHEMSVLRLRSIGASASPLSLMSAALSKTTLAGK